jgi:peptidoglycan/LPS O-acetylase OafA/YrhL
LATYGVDFNFSQHWLYPSDPITTIIAEGHSGFGLFIVLSGFILSLGAINNGVTYGRFLIARILRIDPMFIVCFFY